MLAKGHNSNFGRSLEEMTANSIKDDQNCLRDKDNINENPNAIVCDLLPKNKNNITSQVHQKNFITSDLEKILLANHEGQFEKVNSKMDESLSTSTDNVREVNSIEYRNFEEINFKNINDKPIIGSNPIVVLSGSNLPINMKNVVKCRIFSAKKNSKKHGLKERNLTNRSSNTNLKGDSNPLKRKSMTDKFSSRNYKIGSVQHKNMENLPCTLNKEVGCPLNIFSNSLETTSISQNPSLTVELNTNVPVSINENVNIMNHSKAIENEKICHLNILRKKSNSKKTFVDNKKAVTTTKYLPLKRVDLPSFVCTDSSDLCEIQSNEMVKMKTNGGILSSDLSIISDKGTTETSFNRINSFSDSKHETTFLDSSDLCEIQSNEMVKMKTNGGILSSALTIISDKVTTEPSFNHVNSFPDSKHETTFLGIIEKSHLSTSDMPLTNLPMHDSSGSAISSVMCGEITGIKLPTQEDLDHFNSTILRFHEQQKVKETATVSALNNLENVKLLTNIKKDIFINGKSKEKTLKHENTKSEKYEMGINFMMQNDIVSEHLDNDNSSIDTEKNNKNVKDNATLIEENSTLSLIQNSNFELGLSFSEENAGATDCVAKVFNIESVEDSSYNKNGTIKAVDICQNTKKNALSCIEKPQRKPKSVSNINFKFDASKPYSYNNSSPLTFLQQNVLENVFRHESHPSSTDMGRLARFMKIQWKEVKNWFMARRLYDKQKGCLPKNQLLDYCSYCLLSFQHQSDLQKTHLFSKIHFNNVMITLEKEFDKFVGGMKSEDNIIEYNMDPFFSIEFYKVNPKYSFQFKQLTKGYCFNSKLTFKFISELKEAVKKNKVQLKRDKISLQTHLAPNDSISKTIHTEHLSILANNFDNMVAPQKIPINIDKFQMGKHLDTNGPNCEVLHTKEAKILHEYKEYSSISENNCKIYPLQNLSNASKMEPIKCESNHTSENTFFLHEHSNILENSYQIETFPIVNTNIDQFEKGKTSSQSNFAKKAADCYVHAKENSNFGRQHLNILESQKEIYPLQNVTKGTNVNTYEACKLENCNFSEQLLKTSHNYCNANEDILTTNVGSEASTDYSVDVPLCDTGPHVTKSMNLKESMNINDLIVGFRCPICKIIFQNEWMLIKHSLTHRKFICNDCESIFETENKFLSHLKEHLILSMKSKYMSMYVCYQCRSLDCICQKASSTNFANYIQPRQGKRRPLCSGINDHLQVTVQELVTEFDLNKDNYKSITDNSESSFQNLNSVKKTVLLNKPNTYSNVVTFNCNICESYFFTEDNLLEHLQLHHSKENKKLKNPLQPPDFRKSLETNAKFIFCAYCHVCYDKEYQLRRHIRFRCRFAPKKLNKLLYSLTLPDLANQGKGKHYYSISPKLTKEQISFLNLQVTKFCNNCKMEVNKDNFPFHEKICLIGAKVSNGECSKLPRKSNDAKLSNIRLFKNSRWDKCSLRERNESNCVKLLNMTRPKDIPILESCTSNLVNSHDKINSCSPKENSTNNQANCKGKDDATSLFNLHIPKIKKSTDNLLNYPVKLNLTKKKKYLYICCYCEVPFYNISPLHYHLQNKCQNIILSKELRRNLTFLKEKDYQKIKIDLSDVIDYYKQDGKYIHLKKLLDFNTNKTKKRIICKFCPKNPHKSDLFHHLINSCKHFPKELKFVFQNEEIFIKSYLKTIQNSNVDHECGDVTNSIKKENTSFSYNCHLCDEHFKLSDKFIKHLHEKHNLKIEDSSAFKWLAPNKGTMNDVQSEVDENNALNQENYFKNNTEILLHTNSNLNPNFENNERFNSLDIPVSYSQVNRTNLKIVNENDKTNLPTTKLNFNPVENLLINTFSENNLLLPNKGDIPILEDYKIEDLCDDDLLGDVDNLDNFIETVQLNDNNFSCEEI